MSPALILSASPAKFKNHTSREKQWALDHPFERQRVTWQTSWEIRSHLLAMDRRDYLSDLSRRKKEGLQECLAGGKRPLLLKISSETSLQEQTQHISVSNLILTKPRHIGVLGSRSFTDKKSTPFPTDIFNLQCNVPTSILICEFGGTILQIFVGFSFPFPPGFLAANERPLSGACYPWAWRTIPLGGFFFGTFICAWVYFGLYVSYLDTIYFLSSWMEWYDAWNPAPVCYDHLASWYLIVESCILLQ